jgi:hypothetical protein
MAKSESVAAEAVEGDDFYDAEALMAEDLSELPDEVEISGNWVFQFRGGKPVTGVSDKGPWAMLNLFFQPIEPVDGDELSEAEIENLPSVRHRVFYTKSRDKKDFVALVAKMGVEPAPLKDMLADARGELVVAKVTLGKDNRGDPEYKLTNFRTHTTEAN